MNKVVMINPDKTYQLAEEKARDYFQSLYEQVLNREYARTIMEDMKTWKQKHIRPSFFSFFSKRKREQRSTGYQNYIKWLEITGNLDSYLDRSISYIYMRDLGKTLESADTAKSVNQAVARLKKYLLSDDGEKMSIISMAGMYRWGQKEGIESTVIWLFNKLKSVRLHIPTGLDADQAQRKLIKIIAGVLMHVLEEMEEDITPMERAKELENAIKLGYSYGLTYPFIDDLLDANVLSEHEKKQYSSLIRTTLTTGVVPDLENWSGVNLELLQYIHAELKEAFEYIRSFQEPARLNTFYEQSYVFFHSQEVDRQKHLSNPYYTNEELYIPVIIKSASSRLIVRSVISAPEDEGYDSRTFFYGLYNQLADDFADMYEDLKTDAVTPYTYYLTYHEERPDLINPFELYWTVISNLIHHVYHSDSKTCEVILDRAINGLKRFKERIGPENYDKVMGIFAPKPVEFNQFIQQIVKKAVDVDFFDKLLRDHMLANIKKERKEQDSFAEKIKSIRQEINSYLNIPAIEIDGFHNEPIIEAANYSLEGDGKRLRPIITWVMGVEQYGLDQAAIIPLLRSLEYMHTASLIFDDLPAQDNASVRRGRLTLHQVYNTAIAELTGLFLTQKAIGEQASLHQFDPKTVLHLIHYSSEVTEVMCKGQALDLESKGKRLTVEQLTKMCFYKTGIAFEASLVMPAILARVDDSEIEALKKFAMHAGIAFQIRDDLLDAEGEASLIGKTIGQDIKNNSSTFVTALGIENARREMWEHYCLAIEMLEEIPMDISFLKHLLNYMVNRDH